MSTEDENKAGLVPSQSAALSLSGTTSLIRRGTQDLLAREEAEQWYKRGLELWAQDQHEEAVFWFRKAAERGLASAQWSLGWAYDCGLGLPQYDDHQAALWYRRAAEQGHTKAQIGLGIAYENGWGVPKDSHQAEAWQRKAAEQGDPDGQFSLALMYLDGKCVPHDSEHAVFWLGKSADQGHLGALLVLGKIYEAGEIIPQDHAQAAFWYLKADLCEYAQLRLGHMYEHGLGVPKDFEQAAHWYRKAAEQCDTVLDDLKTVAEQGLLNPSVKPSFLGMDPDWFVCSQHTFEGNPLPEFCSISRNILDCFATALLSTPDLEFPTSPLVMRCRLGEDRKQLMLYLTATLAVGEQTLPLELKEESEVWIGSNLRPLAEVKGIALGSIFWDHSGPHSFFFLDYPGQMIRDKVPGLGALGENGEPCWPECELILDPVTATLREKARRAIDFVQSTTESPIQ